MKLLKKLLPIASLASVAAVAAPLATSCSTSSLNSIEFELIYDGEKQPDPYIAMFDPHEPASEEAIDEADAQSIYQEKMEEDVRVFIDDLIYYSINSAKASLLSESIGKSVVSSSFYVKSTVDSYDKEKAVISFSLVIDKVISEREKKLLSIQEQKKQSTKNNHYEIQFKNFPIELTPDPYSLDEEKPWYVTTPFYEDYEALIDNEDWSISLYEEAYSTDYHRAGTMYWDHSTNVGEDVYVYVFDESGMIGWEATIMDVIETFMCFESHYMQKEYWEE